MKKLIMSVCMLFLMACTGLEKGVKEEKSIGIIEGEKSSDLLSAKGYFQNTGIIKKFSGGFENAGYSTESKYISEDKLQILRQDTATSVLEVYKLSSDRVTLIFSKEGFDESINYQVQGENRSNIIIKAPIKLGKEWDADYGGKNKITGVDKAIKTPSGEYKTIEITYISGDIRMKRYYAAGIGLVKSVYYSNGFERVSELLRLNKIK